MPSVCRRTRARGAWRPRRRRPTTSARLSTPHAPSAPEPLLPPRRAPPPQSADLRGHVCVVTGGRVRIGYEIVLKLLRAGAYVLTTTRFPHDAAARYAAEADFEQRARAGHAVHAVCGRRPLPPARCGSHGAGSLRAIAARPPQPWPLATAAAAARRRPFSKARCPTFVHQAVARPAGGLRAV